MRVVITKGCDFSTTGKTEGPYTHLDPGPAMYAADDFPPGVLDALLRSGAAVEVPEGTQGE